MALTLLLALVGSGCDRAADPAASPTPPPPPVVTSVPTTPPAGPPSPSPSPSPTVAATEDALPLDDEWYVDSDGDGVPDFIEVAVGFDPKVDGCAAEINCPGPAGANVLDLARDQNILLLLDASGSMAGPAGGGKTKMAAARDALERYATATPDFVNLGLLVYGHKGSNQESGKAKSCAGTEVLAPLGKVNHKTFPKVLASFEPTGYTPIAGALQEAAGAFAGREEADNRIIMVSDGIETCGGDPVATARKLAKAGIAVTVDVVGFGVEDTDAPQLQAIAKVTGGTYTHAPTGGALHDYLQNQYEQRVALGDQFLCVLRQTSVYFRCYQRYDNAVVQEMTRRADDAGDDDATAAIRELRDRVAADIRAKRDAFVAQSREQQDLISDAIEKVRRRMRKRYGEDLSALFDCSAGRRLAAASTAVG